MAPDRNIARFDDSTALLDASERLRQRASDSGYLFLPGLLESEKLMDLRRQIFSCCDRHGLLAEGIPVEEGIRRDGLVLRESPDPRWVALYRDLLCIRAFHALCMDVALLNVLTALFGEPALPHSRNICRLVFPDTAEYTTPPHQDHVYIGGTLDTWTAWIPVGDCPRDLGGLALVPGSHRWGLLPVVPSIGVGGKQVCVPDEAHWAYSPMTCGDVLLFHSLTVHRALENTTLDRIRLSVDYRYQPRSHPIRRDSMEPHMGGFGLKWDLVYAGWPMNDPLKYYWREWNLQFVDR
jgi:ectoine hydroxylase-related dioxygenase (phytanoyl-CoA dioxygenase family)